MFVKVYNITNGISKRKLVPIKNEFLKRIKFFSLVYCNLHLIDYQSFAGLVSRFRGMTFFLLIRKTIK